MRVQFAGCFKAEHDMRELIASIEQQALPTPQNHRVAAGSATSFVLRLAGELARQPTCSWRTPSLAGAAVLRVQELFALD